jgi:hypothetical protein
MVDLMITIKTETVPDTYSEKGGCNIRAFCTVRGVDYEAFSRSCPVQALCRALVEAGVRDQPAEVVSSAFPGIVAVKHASIHSEAGYTYGESDKMCIRRGKYVDAAARGRV